METGRLGMTEITDFIKGKKVVEIQQKDPRSNHRVMTPPDAFQSQHPFAHEGKSIKYGRLSLTSKRKDVKRNRARETGQDSNE
jgi:hypothetical protein